MTDLLQSDHDKDQKHLNEENQQAIRLYDAYAKIFSSHDGRLVLKHIADISHYWDSIFTGNSQTFHRSGKQDTGCEIINMVKVVDFETYIWLETQHRNELSDNLNEQIKSLWESRKAIDNI